MDLVERQWDTYRSVVDHDWMEHRELSAACGGALEAWLADHPERHGRARLLDLGCGDLARMAPVFRSLPLGAYVGVDLTEQVLPMARAALGPVAYDADFRHSDVRDVVDGRGGGEREAFDLVHAALVLHHLPDDDKAVFLAALRRRIRPDGLFVWADVFREPGETREQYVQRYASRIRNSWNDIDDDARDAVVSHMSAYDFPADRAAIVLAAQDAGWDWRWAWNGHHRAEAVAVLTPRPGWRGVAHGSKQSPRQSLRPSR